MIPRTAFLAFLLAGCGDAVAGTQDDSLADSGADAPATTVNGGSCNGVAQLGNPVEMIQQASAPPPGPWGGAIVPGTYVLTSFTEFTGVGGANGTSGTLTLAVQVTQVRSSPDRYDAVYFDGPNFTRASYSGAVGADGTLFLTALCASPGSQIDDRPGRRERLAAHSAVRFRGPHVSEVLTKVR